MVLTIVHRVKTMHIKTQQVLILLVFVILIIILIPIKIVKYVIQPVINVNYLIISVQIAI